MITLILGLLSILSVGIFWLQSENNRALRYLPFAFWLASVPAFRLEYGHWDWRVHILGFGFVWGLMALVSLEVKSSKQPKSK